MGLRLALVAAVALAVGIVGWVLLESDGGGADPSHRTAPAPGQTPAPAKAPAKAASVEQLRTVAAGRPYPLYWLGPRKGDTYELTEAGDGKVYVRYLPAGVPVGVNRPDYATVATYPQPDGFATIRQASRMPGEWVRAIGGGGRAVASPKLPDSTYFSYPGAKYLVEVFDPVPLRSRTLVTSGGVRPIR